jgi:hypothetical protein
MKFKYVNTVGGCGEFEEKDIVKAIYTAWNIEADLYSMEKDQPQLLFAPLESNEFNSELLKQTGYYMEDEDKYRVIKVMRTHEIKMYAWDEVLQLV